MDGETEPSHPTLTFVQVNLPARHKMDPPAYQAIDAASIPSAPLGVDGCDGHVKVGDIFRPPGISLFLSRSIRSVNSTHLQDVDLLGDCWRVVWCAWSRPHVHAHYRGARVAQGAGARESHAAGRL